MIKNITKFFVKLSSLVIIVFMYSVKVAGAILFVPTAICGVIYAAVVLIVALPFLAAAFLCLAALSIKTTYIDDGKMDVAIKVDGKQLFKIKEKNDRKNQDATDKASNS